MSHRSKNKTLLLGLALIALVLPFYQPVWHAGFIWDDDSHLTQNPCIIGPLGFKAIWTTSAAVYYPLVLSTFWMLHALWGLNPLPYHLVNVAMHAACAILLWRVLVKLQVRGAWLGAALWALHPVMVESVAWITELKNTQSCLFYLLSILYFLKAQTDEPGRSPNWRPYCMAFLFFMMAITSKSSTVMLPVVLALCIWWQKGGLRRRNAVDLAPFFLISALAGAWTIWEQKFHSGALGTEWVQTWPQRIIIAGCEVWFYLAKLAWPHPLVFIYPRWEIDASQPVEYLPALAAAGALLALWLHRNGRMRPLFFAGAYFVVTLFPVLDFFDVYFFRFSFVADHFQYLASIGPLALLGAGITTAPAFFKNEKRFPLPALCGILLAALGILSWRQCAMYSGVETLWRTTISQNPGCWMARNNLGLDLLQDGRVEEATGHFQKALEIKPDFADAQNDLGLALQENGEVDKAIAHFQKALEIKPDYAVACNNLGSILLQNGRFDEAAAFYRRALKIKPDYAEAQNGLGGALIKNSQVDEAIIHYQKALEIKPDYAVAHCNLADALLQKGQMEAAIVHYRKALAINPSLAEAHANLGFALFHTRRADEAIIHYQKALEIKPDYAEAHNNLGHALFSIGRVDEAIPHFQKALEINPDFPGAHFNLGLALSNEGRLDEAIVHYGKAIELKPDFADAHGELGNILVKKGQVEEGIVHYQKALELQPHNAGIQNNLARVLATCPQAPLRNGAEALALAQQANQATGGNNPIILDTLAAAYAETGHFTEAAGTAQKALDIAISQSNAALAGLLRSRIALYKANTPLRDGSLVK